MRWYRSYQTNEFLAHLCSGEIPRDEVVKAATDFMEIPISELDRREAEAFKDSQECDFGDLLNYRLKQLVQVGDEVVSEETKTFCFSGIQYQTQGKRYTIRELNDSRDGLTGFTALTNSDIPTDPIYWNNFGIRSLWRDGKELWNWHLDYLALFKEQNPNHPQTQEMIDHCTGKAKLMAVGQPT